MLDLSSLFAAPQVAAILGDFGAEVVKVEPPTGDALRSIGLRRQGASVMWWLANRGKRGVTLDAGGVDGRRLLHGLLGQADVVVENATQERAVANHLTYDDMRDVNPRLVVVSVTCFGRAGPYASRPGNGTLAEAFAGLTHMTGHPESAPVLASVPLGDLLTGIVGALGAVLACYHRDARDGPGQHVDVSMFEPVLQLLASTVAGWEVSAPSPSRAGSRLAGGSLRNVYRSSDDRWLVVSAATGLQLARLERVLDGIALADAATGLDPDVLDRAVANWVAARPCAEALAALDSARVPNAPVNDLTALWADPHVRARGSLLVADGGAVGSVLAVAPAPRLGATPGAFAGPSPELGADNAAVYGSWLGIESAALEDLRRRGVV